MSNLFSPLMLMRALGTCQSLLQQPLFGAACSPQYGNFCGPGLSCFAGRCGVCADGATSLSNLRPTDRLQPVRCVNGKYMVTQWDVNLSDPRMLAAVLATLAALVSVGLQCGWCAQVRRCARGARQTVRSLQAARVMNVPQMRRLQYLMASRHGKPERFRALPSDTDDGL